MTFFAELKRRNVFRVAASYAIVAWIVLQVADTTFSRLNIPDWVISLLIILFLLGFPLAMFVAWAYEMTPEGLKPTADVAVQDSIRAQTGQKMNYLMIGALAVLLLIVVVDSYVLEEGPDTTVVAAAAPSEPAATLTATQDEPAAAEAEIPELSIAVLPFRDLSPAGDQGWLADGISEEISNLLTRVDDLLVINTNSAFQFRDQEQNFDSIRQLLNVNYLLTGSLQRIDDELQLTVQLSSTRDGGALWSTRYERESEGIFDIQKEIAEEVSNALQITLATGTFGTTPGMTRNVEAYEEYFRAFQSLQSGESVINIREALAHLERALVLDPDFARASAAILNIYLVLIPVIAGPGQFLERDTRAAEALAHIRAVSPTDPTLQFIEGMNYQRNNELVKAEASFNAAMQRGLPMISAGAVNLTDFAVGKMATGKHSESIGFFERAMAADPLNPSLLAWFSEALAGIDLERAIELNEKALALPGQEGNVRLLGNRLLLALYARDVTELDNYAFALPDGTNRTAINAVMMDSRADPVTALETLHSAAADAGLSAQTVGAMAVWAAWLGDAEFSLELIQRRQDIAGGGVDFFIFRPIFSDVRKLPGFKQLAIDLGLVEYWRATNNWGDFCRPLPETESDFECF